MSDVEDAARVLDAHGVRGMEIAGWTCYCSPEERTDDPSVHIAHALAEAGLLGRVPLHLRQVTPAEEAADERLMNEMFPEGTREDRT